MTHLPCMIRNYMAINCLYSHVQPCCGHGLNDMSITPVIILNP